jgi:hypothetical protein
MHMQNPGTHDIVVTLCVFACLHAHTAACIFVYMQPYNSIKNPILLNMVELPTNTGTKCCPSREVTHHVTFNSSIIIIAVHL